MLNIFTYLSVVYGFSELLLTFVRRSDKNLTSKRGDRGSMLIIWVVILTSLTAGFFYAGRRYHMTSYLSSILGIAIYLAGMIIRWLSILQLKDAFTVDVAVSKGQQLKKDGFYRTVRHPSYLGILLIIIGLGIGMNNIISFLITVVPVFIALSYRINVEEKLLNEFFGNEYREYSLLTKRIIPWIY